MSKNFTTKCTDFKNLVYNTYYILSHNIWMFGEGVTVGIGGFVTLAQLADLNPKGLNNALHSRLYCTRILVVHVLYVAIVAFFSYFMICI
jgi:hypothetical protein